MTGQAPHEEKLTAIEEEVIVLKAIKELIDTIVNCEVLSLSASDPAEIRFKSSTHSKFFNVMLVDLLSKIDKKALVKSETYLSSLANITNNPHFNFNKSVAELKLSTQLFREWLNTCLHLKGVWLPSINKELNLNLRQIDLIKIGGNICRHNFLRSVRIAEDVRKELIRSDVALTQGEALLVLFDLNERLHGDMFQYHSSTIAQHLNDIRWGIYTYLQPELQRQIIVESGDAAGRRFAFPKGIDHAFAKDCYRELMNEVRSEPYMRRFDTRSR